LFRDHNLGRTLFLALQLDAVPTTSVPSSWIRSDIQSLYFVLYSEIEMCKHTCEQILCGLLEV
jgi:hypothetical protein